MFLFAGIDFHVNFITMDIGMMLDYICFCAFRCNGTSVIAEMHRVILQDRSHWLWRYAESASYYEFLYDACLEIMPGRKVGNSTDNRSNFSCGNTNVNWSEHRASLLDLCMKFHQNPNGTMRKKDMARIFKEITHTLCKAKDPSDTSKPLYHGAGDFCALQFIQLASAFGLIPMYCMTFANLGPSKNLVWVRWQR